MSARARYQPWFRTTEDYARRCADFYAMGPAERAELDDFLTACGIGREVVFARAVVMEVFDCRATGA